MVYVGTQRCGVTGTGGAEREQRMSSHWQTLDCGLAPCSSAASRERVRVSWPWGLLWAAGRSSPVRAGEAPGSYCAAGGGLGGAALMGRCAHMPDQCEDPVPPFAHLLASSELHGHVL